MEKSQFKQILQNDSIDESWMKKAMNPTLSVYIKKQSNKGRNHKLNLVWKIQTDLWYISEID